MLNTNMECSRDYPQHFQLYFHVLHRFMLNKNVSTHLLQVLSLNTMASHRSCASGSTPNTNISSIMCFRVHAPHKTYIYIYIINNWLTSNIQNKSSCLYAVGSLTQYKIKHQYNYHDQQAYSYKWQVQNQNITYSVLQLFLENHLCENSFH